LAGGISYNIIGFAPYSVIYIIKRGVKLTVLCSPYLTRFKIIPMDNIHDIWQKTLAQQARELDGESILAQVDFRTRLKLGRKIFALIISLLISAAIFGQPLMDIGFMRSNPTLKIGYELPVNWLNLEISGRTEIGNYYPIFGFQAGITIPMPNDGDLRLSAGSFLSTNYIPIDKEKNEGYTRLGFGGSIRYKWDFPVFISSEYNGDGLCLNIGYIFCKAKSKQ